jgi:hypothetical protein
MKLNKWEKKVKLIFKVDLFIYHFVVVIALKKNIVKEKTLDRLSIKKSHIIITSHKYEIYWQMTIHIIIKLPHITETISFTI